MYVIRCTYELNLTTKMRNDLRVERCAKIRSTILIHLSSIEHLNVNELRIRVYISYFIRFSRHQREPRLRFEHDDFSLSPISHSRYTIYVTIWNGNSKYHFTRKTPFYILYSN